MPKMKQATLFSLKSWKTKPEDLIVYKKKLEKENTHETVILKTLALLNYSNKESILSHEIDKTLKVLAENKNKRIAMEAKLLIDHWSLNGPESLADSSQACAIQKDADIEVIDQKKIKSSSIDITEIIMQTPIINKESLSKSSGEILNKESAIKVVPKITSTKPPEKICATVEAKEMGFSNDKNSGRLVDGSNICKSKPSFQSKTNDKYFSKREIKAIKDRIETISKVFLETYGMQQIKLYLDHQLV